MVADVAASCRAADQLRFSSPETGHEAGKSAGTSATANDARQQRKRSFERKLDAQRFARSVETDLLRGDWINPRRGQELFELWAASGWRPWRPQPQDV